MCFRLTPVFLRKHDDIVMRLNKKFVDNSDAANSTSLCYTRGIFLANGFPSPAVPYGGFVIRLRTHSQKSTVAARAMAERKTVGHRS